MIDLLGRGLGLVALCMVVVLAPAPAAEAHTEFVSSDPAGGHVVDAPISEIRIEFTAESLIAGDGFLVLTPEGEVIQPEIIVGPERREFVLVLDPPLVNGVVGVQWSVRAGDAHPIEGTFSFTTTATAVPAPDAPSQIAGATPGEQAPAPTVNAGVGTDVAASDGDADAGEGAVGVAKQPDSESDALGAEESSGLPEPIEAAASPPPEQTVSLDEFLNVDDGNALAGPIGFLGRLASQLGSLVAVGVMIFAILVSARTAGEMQVFVHLARQAGLLTLIGAIIEAVGLVLTFDAIGSALISSAGLAVLLRALGAAGLLVSTGGAVAADVEPSRVTIGVAAGSTGTASVPSAPALPTALAARASDASATFEGSGRWFTAMILLSFLFDGHTVTKGERLLTGAIHLVHVAGAAVWVGGLVCLLVLSRSRTAQLAQRTYMSIVVRFSVVAAVALAAVGAAGVALTIVILDSVSELWSTSWGRLLVAKVATVSIAVAAGAFNHFVLVPQMQTTAPEEDVSVRFLRVIKLEAVALGVAIVITAALVAAAS